MRRLAVLVAALLCCGSAWAHRIDEYLQATMLTVKADRVEGSMRLIPGMMVADGVIAAIDRNGDGVFSDEEERAYAEQVLGDLTLTVDGMRMTPRLVTWIFPQPGEMRDGQGEIHLEYVADVPRGAGERRLRLENRHRAGASVYLVNAVMPEDKAIAILGQTRDRTQAVYEMEYREDGVGVAAGRWGSVNASMAGEFGGLFRLGMRHIAEGTDHLLFLLTLLLPAPLVVCAGRWGGPATVRASLGRILGIVTAFTVGHSLTLMLAAMGGVWVASRPVEVLIAVSILVSAVHALRPIVAGKETMIAAGFGLIHGLAFAATLDRLGLGRWERVGGVLAFNLGIETMQMVVVAGVLPSLMLMSRTRAYGVVRVGGSVVAGVAAVGWIVERVLNVGTPVDAVLSAAGRHGFGFAVALFAVSLVCWGVSRVGAEEKRSGVLSESGTHA